MLNARDAVTGLGDDCAILRVAMWRISLMDQLFGAVGWGSVCVFLRFYGFHYAFITINYYYYHQHYYCVPREFDNN